MITASHNPAADNGYKLYLSDGGQVIPPADAEIEKRIAALGPLSRIPVAPAGSPLVSWPGDEIAQAYLAAVAGEAGDRGVAGARARARPGRGRAGAGPGRRARPGGGLNVVYTAMHGVAGQLMLRAMRMAGFGAPHVVAAQAEPDPDFPTVAFPNPEEPGALDLALADARRLGADLVIASDPDGDRLAVAVPEPGGGGDETAGLAGADRGPGRRPARGGPAGLDRGSGRAAGAAGGLDRGLLDAAGQDRRGGRGPLRRDPDRVQVDRPGGRRHAGSTFRLRLRGGARLRRRRRGAGQGRVRRRAGDAAAGGRRRGRRAVRSWTCTTTWSGRTGCT